MIALESALDATISADVIDPGWWADPGTWLIAAALLIIIIIVGIYLKVLTEHQGFNINR